MQHRFSNCFAAMLRDELGEFCCSYYRAFKEINFFKLFRCGYCTGGNTSRPDTFGKDACGVCDGDNSTCKDCSGVINGGKTYDRCGECKDANDPTRNTGCIKLFFAGPFSGPMTGGTEITIEGAGLQSKTIGGCQFSKDGSR